MSTPQSYLPTSSPLNGSSVTGSSTDTSEPLPLVELRRRATEHLEAHNFSDAERYLEQAVEFAPEDAELLTLLGVSKVSQKQYADGSYCFIRALDLDPSLDAAKVYLGEVYCTLGQFDRGIKLLKDAFWATYVEGQETPAQSKVCRRAGASLGAMIVAVKTFNEQENNPSGPNTSQNRANLPR